MKEKQRWIRFKFPKTFYDAPSTVRRENVIDMKENRVGVIEDLCRIRPIINRENCFKSCTKVREAEDSKHLRPPNV